MAFDRITRPGRLQGYGRVFAVSSRVAIVLAGAVAIWSWHVLEQELGTALPWAILNLAAAITFYVVFGIAWVLGSLGGTLGWFAGRRIGRSEQGAAAGVIGLWAGLILGAALAVWAGQAGPPPQWLLVPLLYLLPLLGPWVATRWLAEPTARAWEVGRTGLLGFSRFLSERLILRRPIRFDARGLVLGLAAGLGVGVVSLAGLFGLAEAVVLAQLIHFRNEPINAPEGPVEFSHWISLQMQGRPAAARNRDIVVLEIDDWTYGRLTSDRSMAGLNARLLRLFKRWGSGAVVLPLAPTALTTARGRQWIVPPGPEPRLPPGPPPGGFVPAPMEPPPAPGESPNPSSPPLDPAALRREERDVPELAAALRAHPRAVLCLLPRSAPPPGPWAAMWRRRNTPVPTQAPPQIYGPLLDTGRPLGSAEFAPFHVRQLQTLQLTDGQGRWALPLLLATRGEGSRVSPAPSADLTDTLVVDDRTLRLAGPGRLLVNVYGSRPGAIFPHVSYSAVLNGTRLYDRRLGRWVTPARFFRDRIVFLDTPNQPSYDTPVGPFRATELLAMATDNILAANPLAPPSPGLEMGMLALFGALAGHLSIGRSPIAGAVQAGVLLVCYALAATVLFVLAGLWLPLVSVTAVTLCAYLLVIQLVFTVDELELARQRDERAQLEQEVAISRAIQTSLLPAGHLRAGAFEIVSHSDPAREVGGDFYNVLPLTPAAGSNDECSRSTVEGSTAGDSPTANLQPSTSSLQPDAGGIVGIVLGDVSGKGVQGAMYMTVATTLVEARAEPGVGPEEVLEIANAHLYPKIHRLRMFVTVFYGVLDIRTGRLEFASAGQVPPVLASGGSTSYCPTQGVPLGALPRVRYDRRALCLKPGDTLVLASDGFVEARSPGGEPLGYDGFLQIVARHAGADPRACLEGIFGDARRFSGNAEEQDDRTLVVIRHHAA